MRSKTIITALLLSVLALQTALAEPSAMDDAVWDRLLKSHVQVIDGGKATTVDYQAMLQERQKLKQYLQALSSVSRQQFDQWPKPEQLAFLINAYNAATVELILTAWPDLNSIKELGGLFSSPWKKNFVSLLGEMRSLDDIEHGLIRGSARYNDPRIHFAVNCASIGCPALRAEAYDGKRLEQQLSEQSALFLQDRSRNQVAGTTIRVSSIFKWYREDFEKGWQGFTRLEDFLLAHAEDLGVSPAVAQQLKTGKATIEFMTYDWRLNKQ